MTLPPDRTPVIIGVGEITDRPADPAHGLEPAALMAEALKRASADAAASGDLLAHIDSLDVVNQMTWRYANICAVVQDKADLTPRRAHYSPVGGEAPVRLINEAALRIARGESAIAAICGGEAQHTFDKARAAKIELPWTPRGPKEDLSPLVNFIHPIAAKHLKWGGMIPAQIYPFYESAAQAAWAQSPAEALAESGALWSRYAAVAAKRENAWVKQPYSAAEITTPSPENRLVVWPYTKRMVANPSVNIGGAVIIASLAAARRLCIAEDKLIYVWGGAAANEPRDYLSRDQYQRSDAQDIVLKAAQRIAGADGFGALELYSCFPIVPKMARRTLGYGEDVAPSVTGGLSFFGAPVNTYMTNAAVAMTQTLRASDGLPGLLYGQGEFVTKHHALVLSRRPSETDALSAGYDLQAEVDRARGPIPKILAEYTGEATLEAVMVFHARDGAPEFGAVIARTACGDRLMARVLPCDDDSMKVLVSLHQSPIGAGGGVREGTDGLLHWRAR